MRTAIVLFAALAAALAGCGVVADWSPEELRVHESLDPGDEEEGRVVARGDYDDPDDWEAEIGPLPPGVDYDTESVGINFYDELVIEYEIRVEEWVAPGVYRFEVVYQLYEFLSLFREEVDIEFVVEVRDPDPDEELLVLRVAQAFSPGESGAVVAITR